VIGRIEQVIVVGAGLALAVAALGAFLFWTLFGAPGTSSETERFVVPLNTSPSDVVEQLENEGHIKSTWAFNLIHSNDIDPGAYRLAPTMNAFAVSRTLQQGPSMTWIVIPEGWRKEQIAELLADALGWRDREKQSWITSHTARKPDEVEGVYFPDTYLIPVDDGQDAVADRLRARFHEKFQPYAEEALRRNIKWTSLLKIASLIQREAAGKDDMPLIAGVLWNRLRSDQKLDIDATVQYARDTRLAYQDDPCDAPDGEARGSEDGVCTPPEMARPNASYIGIYDWWTPIAIADKQSASPYNTYRYSKLPPHPIANPGLTAIEAALYPEETECFYYLHDRDGHIHCAPTYEEHRHNIERYLKSAPHTTLSR
jgi:UPF0755 protein